MIGLNREENGPSWEMILLDPARNETETCGIPKFDKKGSITRINFIGNDLFAFKENGDPFRLDGKSWIPQESMKLPRKDAAAIVLQDGRWFVSGGSPLGVYESLKSTEYLSNSGEVRFLSVHFFLRLDLD